MSERPHVATASADRKPYTTKSVEPHTRPAVYGTAKSTGSTGDRPLGRDPRSGNLIPGQDF